MPTAAKLIAAVLFAALAWIVSENVREVMPGEGRGATLLSPINALLGLAAGWRVLGNRAGDGYVPAVGYGLTTVCVIYFWSLLIWGCYEMIMRSIGGRYSGPFDAIEGLGDLMLDYSAMIVTPTIIGSAVFGSILCALVVEYFAHRWS